MPKVNNGNYAKNYTMATIIYNDLEKTVYRHMISGTCLFLLMVPQPGIHAKIE